MRTKEGNKDEILSLYYAKRDGISNKFLVIGPKGTPLYRRHPFNPNLDQIILFNEESEAEDFAEHCRVFGYRVCYNPGIKL